MGFQKSRQASEQPLCYRSDDGVSSVTGAARLRRNQPGCKTRAPETRLAAKPEHPKPARPQNHPARKTPPPETRPPATPTPTPCSGAQPRGICDELNVWAGRFFARSLGGPYLPATAMTWLNRILLALFITAGLAFLPSYEQLGAEDLSRVRSERDALIAGNSDLRGEIKLLEAEVDALQRLPDDPSSHERVDRELARIAREDLNMIKPGELVFELHRPEPDLARGGQR